MGISKTFLDEPIIIFDRGEILFKYYKIRRTDENGEILADDQSVMQENEDTCWPCMARNSDPLKTHLFTIRDLFYLLDGDGYLPDINSHTSDSFTISVSFASNKFDAINQLYNELSREGAFEMITEYDVPCHLFFEDKKGHSMRLTLCITEQTDSEAKLEWAFCQRVEATREMLVYLCRTLTKNNMLFGITIKKSN